MYVAGQIALVPGTMQMVDGGICQECRLALRHVGRVISGIDQNSLLRDVVQVTIIWNLIFESDIYSLALLCVVQPGGVSHHSVGNRNEMKCDKIM